jgi:hypothetical protein
MPTLALAIREVANGQEVGRLEQAHAIFEGQPLAGLEPGSDVGQTGGVDAILDVHADGFILRYCH